MASHSSMNQPSPNARSHRQFILQQFDLWQEELPFVEKLLQEDIRNNSAWNHRPARTREIIIRCGKHNSRPILRLGVGVVASKCALITLFLDPVIPQSLEHMTNQRFVLEGTRWSAINVHL